MRTVRSYVDMLIAEGVAAEAARHAQPQWYEKPLEVLVPQKQPVFTPRKLLTRPVVKRRLLRLALLRCGDNRCAYCGECLTLMSMTIDHVEARSLGGSHTWDNMVAACYPCNQRKKSERWPIKFPPTHL